MTTVTPPKPPVVLYAGRDDEREIYERTITRAADRAGLTIDLRTSTEDVRPEEVDYLVFAGSGPVDDFTPYSNLKAILSLWAGVEAVMRLDPPSDVPVVRMVEDGMTLGMIDYVSGHVLRHHLDIDKYIASKPIRAWEKGFPPLARDRRVGVLGLGALGSACAQALARHGFRVSGWSRTEKQIPTIDCHHGSDGLAEVLSHAEILVLLIPHTPETERLINAERLALMPEGSALINAARGPLIDHDALLEALDSGRLRHATMDVFDVEPLPDHHPYWRHPRVTVTPHIASGTRPETASESLVAQIMRAEQGEPLKHVVDRDRGY